MLARERQSVLLSQVRSLWLAQRFREGWCVCRCNVQLARPGHSQARSGPMAVRCGNTGLLKLEADVKTHEIVFFSLRFSNDYTWECGKVSLPEVLHGTSKRFVLSTFKTNASSMIWLESDCATAVTWH